VVNANVYDVIGDDRKEVESGEFVKNATLDEICKRKNNAGVLGIC